MVIDAHSKTKIFDGYCRGGAFWYCKEEAIDFQIGAVQEREEATHKRLITEGYQRLSVTNLKSNAHWHQGITWTSFQFQVDNREFSMLAGAT